MRDLQDIEPTAKLGPGILGGHTRLREAARAVPTGGGVWVWLNTNSFKAGAKQYHPSKALSFIAPTSDTREVLAAIEALVRAVWRMDTGTRKQAWAF